MNTFHKPFIMDGMLDFQEEEFPLLWSMTPTERRGFINLLQKIKPKVAIEIGTYKGGSLQVISKYAEKVYAIDNDPTVKERLGDRFHNVEFLIGDSKEIIPKLIDTINEKGESVEFALIDGDHSFDAVRMDIKNLLAYIPKTQLHVVLHDSFNPECRRGMKAYDYHLNDHVHYIELDYVTGTYEPDGLKRQMWGGLAMILLLPEKRTDDLIVLESSISTYNTVYLHSIHHLKKTFSFLKPIYQILRKIKNGS